MVSIKSCNENNNLLSLQLFMISYQKIDEEQQNKKARMEGLPFSRNIIYETKLQ